MADLVARWKMDDAALATLEGQYPLAMMGAGSGPTLVDGVLGTARLFQRGIDGPVQWWVQGSADESAREAGRSDWTVSFWVKRTDMGGQAITTAGTILALAHVAGHLLQVRLRETDGRISLLWNVGVPSFANLSDVTGFGWHQVVITKRLIATLATVTCYLDGVAGTPVTGLPNATNTEETNWFMGGAPSFNQLETDIYGGLSATLDDVRFYSGLLNTDEIAVLAAGGTLMAVETFGVTSSTLRAHHFPHFPGEFSVSTKPTSATVAEMITAAAAELGGKLLAEGVTPSSIDADDTPNAYAWCADTVRLGAAARVARTVTGMRPEAALAWQAQFDARCKLLDEVGYSVLGDVTLATDEEPNGPHSHIGNHGLDTGDETLISDVVPRFRRSDEL